MTGTGDAPELRRLVIDGVRTLDEPAGGGRPEVLTPILYASAANAQTWSPADPADGLTVYGGALIAGLRGKPDYHPPPPHTVVFLDLFRDMKKRVALRLGDEHQATLRLGGTIDDLAITDNSKRHPARPAPPPRAITKAGLQNAAADIDIQLADPATGATVPFEVTTTYDDARQSTRIDLVTPSNLVPVWLTITGPGHTLRAGVLPPCHPHRLSKSAGRSRSACPTP